MTDWKLKQSKIVKTIHLYTENKAENPVFIIMMGRVTNEALLGGLHMSLVWISKPFVSCIEEEAM